MSKQDAVPRLALTRGEVAQALGVSVDFVDDHVWSELRLVRRGRKALCPVRELERWLDANGHSLFGGDAA